MKRKYSKLISMGLIALMLFSLTGCTKPGVASIEKNQKIELAITDYSEYFELGEYKNLTYQTSGQYDLTDAQKTEQIQMVINEDFSDLIEVSEVTDRPAALGDSVTVMYKGLIDNEPFDGGDSPDEGVTFVLGYGNYQEDFENGIVGMSVKESKEISVTFPETADKASLDGKTAIFNVTLDKIYTYSLPDITNEMVKSHTGYETYDEYYNALSAELYDSIDYLQKTEISNQLLEQIVNNSTYKDYPQDELDELVRESVEIAEARAANYGMTVDEYVSSYYSTTNIDDYKAYMLEQAKEYMKIKMAVCGIAKSEGIELTQDDIDAYKQYLSEYYGLESSDDITNYITNDDIKFECIVEKVQDVIIENAKASN